MIRKNTTYRGLLDELIEMPRIRRVLGLTELPTPSTLYKAFNRLDMTVWRVLLNLSAMPLVRRGVVGIDAPDLTEVTPQHTTRNDPNSRFSNSK